jgi:hypothetical protein
VNQKTIFQLTHTINHQSISRNMVQHIAVKSMLICLFLCIVFLPLLAQKAPRHTPARLVPGVPLEQVLVLTPGGTNRMEYSVSVPRNAFGVRFDISGATADLDLLLSNSDGLFAFSEQESFQESLMVTRLSDPPLQDGIYTLEVAYQWNRLPFFRGQQLDQVPFTLEMTLIVPDPGIPLEPDGTFHQGTLQSTTGMLQAFEVNVPRGTSDLRIDLTGPQGDLDLFVFIGGAGPNPRMADYTSRFPGSTEWIVLDPVADATSRYGVLVQSPLDDGELEFTLVASVGSSAPILLQQIPPIPRPTQYPERALAATVEVLGEFGGGSGVIVSPHGWILTNYHVLELEAQAGHPVRVGFSLDNQLPAQELFLADIVRFDQDTDLALIRIVSGLYGQRTNLPEFPWVEIDNPNSLGMTDPLWLVGYPWIGGLGTRGTLTLSRGVVSGFERRSFGRLIKTDGIISSGSSGGAAFNRHWKLIGLPTMMSFEGSAQLSFIHPVDLIPKDWWGIIGIPGF